MSPSITADTGPAQARGSRAATVASLAAACLTLLILLALSRHLLQAGRPFPIAHRAWLLLHLASVLPAIPIGGFLLVRRKGDHRHKRLGRVWAVLMLVAASSSFGLGAHLGPIHALSALTLVTIPRAVLAAMRGRIEQHRRLMLIVVSSLLAAGFFTLLPQRLLGSWLFGLS